MDDQTLFNYPENYDLRKLFKFCSKSGHIWLDENRMVLMHVAAMGNLRKELIHALGWEQAKGILMRMGYISGVRDAELAKKVRSDASAIEAFVVGPQLHMLEGNVRVTPIELDFDIKKGKFYGDFLWKDSWEVEMHLQDFGVNSAPVCWTQIGYASGYTTTFMGKLIVFKEVECCAMGHKMCRIIGKPVDEWEDGKEQMQYFEPNAILSQLLDLQCQVEHLRSSLCEEKCDDMIGQSSAFRTAYDFVRKAATSQVTVLLLGETGVGKERFARSLHKLSSRSTQTFVAVNCAAIPHDLIESELFGVEKGAFTGAQQSRIGRFERANGGTLFLDEIGELPLAAQAKLLRVLQEGEIERLGDDTVRKINVRVVAATNVNLQQAVREGKFRSDLYYRLNVYPIMIPPLRERKSDIPLLVEAFIAKFSSLYGKKIKGLTDKALKAVLSYQWPGNIRELENMIERGVILVPNGGRIEVEHLFAMYAEAPNFNEPGFNIVGNELSEIPHPHLAEDGQEKLCENLIASRMTLDELENLLLNYAVKKSEGNLSQAARVLGITRPQLAYRLSKRENQSTLEK